MCGIFAPVAISYSWFWLPNASKTGILIAFIVIPSSIWSESLRYIFLGQNDIKAYTIVPAARAALWAILNTLILGFIRRDVIAAMAVWLFQINMVNLFSSLYLLRKQKIRFAPNLYLYKKMLLIGIRALISQVGVKLMYSGDILILNRLVSIEQIGFYSLATSITRIMERSTNAAGSLIFPMSAQDATAKTDKLTSRVLRNILVLNLS